MDRNQRFRVLRRHFSWSPNRNLGLIHIQLENQPKVWQIRVDNAAEFAAILALLQGDQPVYGTADGWLTTTEEGPVKP